MRQRRPAAPRETPKKSNIPLLKAVRGRADVVDGLVVTSKFSHVPVCVFSVVRMHVDGDFLMFHRTLIDALTLIMCVLGSGHHRAGQGTLLLQDGGCQQRRRGFV